VRWLAKPDTNRIVIIKKWLSHLTS
jgi:hypothetical protein